MFKKRRGQTTLEYIILVAAVIAALLVFLSGAFRTTLNGTVQNVANDMGVMGTRITQSRPLAP